MNKHRFKVKEGFSGTRLDMFISIQGIDLSKRKIKEVIDAGGVYINGKRARIASRPVNDGDLIEMQYSLETLKKIKQREHEISPEEILFHDGDVIAVNKPPGLPTQATRDQSLVHLEAAVKKYLAKLSPFIPAKKQQNVYLVHRLDKETSGVVLLATSNKATTFLTDQFRERTVAKEYLAICTGIPSEKKFTVSCFLSPIDRKTGNVAVVKSGGKSSKTVFEVLNTNKEIGICLIRCLPETGRSHQIRVHLAHKGFPIIGDKRYHPARSNLPAALESLSSEHHFLHAASLTFKPTPDSPQVLVQAKMPPNFEKFIRLANL
jgi:RluA family pseudouridine synthase